MYLNKLEVHGFKSFAQKTVIRFDSGINVIVGPNGCGKTNVADAIRWVLGEQKASSLRSEKMENVIFNGTKSRKPLGMAEVSLTIENTKNILPTEYTEITITRRLYRSGESEYLLNKVPCRLKDIVNLFMDTGMGPDAYSVIELKMIEEILSERYDDRRRLFEEAAGVTKYKQRRKQALRKLEETKTSLTRIDDLLKEKEKMVANLHRQALRAEQEKQLRSELKELEVLMAQYDFVSTTKQIEPLSLSKETHEKSVNELLSTVGLKESELVQHQTENDELEKRLSSLQKELNLKIQLVAGIESQIGLKEQSIKNFNDNIHRAESDIKEITESLSTIDVEIEQLTIKIVEQEEIIASAKSSFQLIQGSVKEYEGRLNLERTTLNQLNQQNFKLINDSSAKQKDYERLMAKKDSHTTQMRKLTEDTESLKENIETSQIAVDELVYELKTLQRQIDEKLEEVNNLKNIVENKRLEMDNKRSELSSIKANYQTAIQKKSLFESIISSYEGVPEGVKYSLSSKKDKFTLFSDIFLLKHEEWNPVVSQWLGEKANLIVCKTENEALAQIKDLTANKKGIAAFLILEKLTMLNQSDSPKLDGVERLSDLLAVSKEYSSLAKIITTGVYITDSDDMAAKLSTQNPAYTFLTKSGLIFSNGYVIKGGESGKENHSRMGIADKIKEIELQLEKISQDVSAKENEIKILKDETDALLSGQSEKELDILRKRQMEVNTHSVRMTSELNSINSRIERNSTDINRLKSESQLFDEEMKEIQPMIDEINYEVKQLQEKIQVSTSKVQTMEEEWKKESDQVLLSSSRLKEYEGNLVNTHNEKERVIREKNNLIERNKRLADDIVRHQQLIEVTKDEIFTLNETLISSYEERDSFKKETDDLSQTVSEKRGNIHRIENELRDFRLRRDNDQYLLNQTIQKLTQLMFTLEKLVENIKEKYDIELVSVELPELAEMEYIKNKEELSRLKERVVKFGITNPLALEEYEKTKADLEIMVVNKTDLVTAEQNLLETITEINQTAQQLFLDVFAKIRDNFNQTFSTLFEPGDEADVKLEEGVDPLEAKIEILAKPRGKRPQAISLLSGGEKTLTAIALLFAIYLVKPSPFCILDEVDAPLDDANIDRFSKIIRKFSDNSQFIIITHNKRTMEYANTMYGVTMEEMGISKIVGVKFGEQAMAN